MRYYDSIDEVRRRLSNGIILYRGEPVLALEAKSAKGTKAKYAVVIRNLPEQDKSWSINLDDPELNYKQINLGFLNVDDEVVRAVRYPQRGVQQSLSENNCYINALEGGNARARLDRITTLVNLLRTSQSAVDCMAGRFPSMDEARKAVEGGAKAKAFHKDWAYQKVFGAPAIWYKTRPVGLTIDPRRILKLEPSMQYLKEPLEEIGLRVS